MRASLKQNTRVNQFKFDDDKLCNWEIRCCFSSQISFLLLLSEKQKHEIWSLIYIIKMICPRTHNKQRHRKLKNKSPGWVRRRFYRVVEMTFFNRPWQEIGWWWWRHCFFSSLFNFIIGSAINTFNNIIERNFSTTSSDATGSNKLSSLQQIKLKCFCLFFLSRSSFLLQWSLIGDFLVTCDARKVFITSIIGRLRIANRSPEVILQSGDENRMQSFRYVRAIKSLCSFFGSSLRCHNNEINRPSQSAAVIKS